MPVISGVYLITEYKIATIVMIDRSTSVIFAHIVPHKGVRMHWYAEAMVRNDLESLGYKKFVLQCDQESALKAVMKPRCS